MFTLRNKIIASRPGFHTLEQLGSHKDLFNPLDIAWQGRPGGLGFSLRAPVQEKSLLGRKVASYLLRQDVWRIMMHLGQRQPYMCRRRFVTRNFGIIAHITPKCACGGGVRGAC